MPGSSGGGAAPAAARAAFAAGDDRGAYRELRAAQEATEPGSLAWARLERLCGLLLIHMLREVEGTFALERADTLLDQAGAGRPGMEALEGPEH